MRHLASLKELKSLRLEGTQITDAGLNCLDGLVKCEEIAIGATAVTGAGITAARRQRPKIRFVEYEY